MGTCSLAYHDRNCTLLVINVANTGLSASREENANVVSLLSLVIGQILVFVDNPLLKVHLTNAMHAYQHILSWIRLVHRKLLLIKLEVKAFFVFVGCLPVITRLCQTSIFYAAVIQVRSLAVVTY
jgi:hypothetical protein